MSLLIPTYEEKVQNDKERMNIINDIMNIQSTKHLHTLALMSSRFHCDEINNIPLSLNDFVDMLELPVVVRLMDIFEKEPSQYIVNAQMMELLKKAIESYTGMEEEKESA